MRPFLFYAFAFSWFFLWLLNVYRSLAAAKWILDEMNALRMPSDMHLSSSLKSELFVLLPALREQSIVTDTLEHFQKISRHISNITIVVITGSSEEVENNSKTIDLTRDAVDCWITNNPEARVIRLHETAHFSTKATKLQFAWHDLSKKLGADRIQASWFAIYDFDSRPPYQTFLSLDKYINSDDFDVIQQVPHIAGKKMDGRHIKHAGHLQAVAHYDRTLSIETHLRRAQSKHASYEIKYAMGAGLFLRVSCLEHTGGFPYYSDDIALGYRLDLVGMRRTVLPVPNIVEPAPSFRAIFKQSRRIYIGVFSLKKELDWFRNISNHRSHVPKLRLRLIVSYLSNFTNSVRFLLFLAAVVVGTSTSAYFLPLLLVAYPCFEGSLIFCYSKLMTKIRKACDENYGSIKQSLFETFLAIFYLGAFQSLMILDYILLLSIQPKKSVMKIISDKTPR